MAQVSPSLRPRALKSVDQKLPGASHRGPSGPFKYGGGVKPSPGKFKALSRRQLRLSCPFSDPRYQNSFVDHTRIDECLAP